jgi:2-dehydro-3-deoxyphosphogluconate aldolase / (4S)-4-hydroxy-2-oxoglutarate aldolase
MNISQDLKHQFIVPVIRFTDPATVEAVVEALFHGGFKLQEVTLMSEALVPLLGKLRARLGVTLGAGTVLTGAQAQAVIGEGAQFLVSPGFSSEVSAVAKRAGSLYVPGVLTPTEVMVAVNAGHELLKLFPAATMGGVRYLKNLEGPFPHVRWMLSGGIKASELASYQLPSVQCVGLGQDLFPSELVAAQQWDAITKLAQALLKKGTP